jgi:hypothetical protein
VVDELSKYSWIFLTKSKDPPIELTKLFLKEYAHVDGGKIRCDQGGELPRSAEWRKMVLEEFQYYVEPTRADSPSQNGQVENTMVHLGPSYALCFTVHNSQRSIGQRLQYTRYI